MLAGRPTVSHGPIPEPRAMDVAEIPTHKLQHHDNDLTQHSLHGEPAAVAPSDIRLNNIPKRFITRKCRTAYPTPSNFSLSTLQQSASPPSVVCRKDNVHGCNVTGLYAGSPLHRVASGRGGLGCVVYVTAALGLVHNLDTNEQLFFEGHNDDISCVNTSTSSSGGEEAGEWIATGQMGKRSYVCIWQPFGDERLPLPAFQKIGEGYFSRGVCAVALSPQVVNSKTRSTQPLYVAAIGCDDNHTMGIFDVTTGELLAEDSAGKGIPPQIHSLVWVCSGVCADAVESYMGSGALGKVPSTVNPTAVLYDVLCTAGERIVKVSLLIVILLWFMVTFTSCHMS